ncbi:DnaB-like helicase N-terminal domain-containing protein [Streptomyces sp. NPDC057682]|uniref:DnaB-like helicase N-terminal domain-containing protein n=1 Tax=Streptomyces sp. NPDC057682 TaxID=3346210 RepID=UPI0036B78167
MSHAPEPSEDDVASIPPPPPVFHAEQALLGALLREPHRLDDVSGIAADSFSTSAHAALFTAISTLPRPDPAEHRRTTRWLNRVLSTAQGLTRGLTAIHLHTLVQACLWPSHAPAYARMVEAEHARRRLQSAAEGLVHTVHDTSLPHVVEKVLAEADTLTAVVADIGQRFPTRTGVRPRTAAPPPSAVPNLAEAVEEEQLLLATATARPADIGSVRWLLPDDLILPLHAGLWECLIALARRKEPVDPVTVLWEAQQRGLLDSGSRPADILHVLAEPEGSVEHWADRALERSLLATAEHTGQRIQAYAHDCANTPGQLVVGSRRALGDFSAVRARWQRATGAAPPPRQRPAPTTRAGPPTTTAAHAARSARATR